MTEPDAEGLEARHQLWKWAGFAIGVVAALVMAALFVAGALTAAGTLGRIGGMSENISVFLLIGAFGVGLTQLLWLVPILIVASIRRNSRGFALGVGSGALVVALLNIACFGVVMGGLSGGF